MFRDRAVLPRAPFQTTVGSNAVMVVENFNSTITFTEVFGLDALSLHRTENGNYEVILYGVYSTEQLAREVAEELLELGNILAVLSHYYKMEQIL